MLQYETKVDPQTNTAFIETSMSGKEILCIPLLNKGTAFTRQERIDLGILGKLPERVESLDEQLVRAYQQYACYSSVLQRNIYLNNLHDKNEILFYKLLSLHLTEMLPMIYTPVVGAAVQEFSHEFRQPRGLFLSYPERGNLEAILDNRTHPDIELLVVTDGEGVLGIGDQGVGAIDIPIAKLIVYSLCGMNPYKTVPVLLDVGTDNPHHLNDPLYLGWRHPRIRGAEYDAFIAEFVAAVNTKFPKAFLHWEDFGRDNARRILDTYRDKSCMFNDDMQGTGAVALAALLAASQATNTTLADQKIVIFGAGTAGVGIADQLYRAMRQLGLSEEEARSRFWLIDKQGLLREEGSSLLDFQRPYAKTPKELLNWPSEAFDLLSVVQVVHPSVLIGASAVRGAFSEAVVRAMASHCERPIICPLSNPTDRSEAKPEDLLNWTDGRVLMACGSPFSPVSFHGVMREFAQCNNALAFPGIGLGLIASGATHLTDNMLLAAAKAISLNAPVHKDALAPLLPRLHQLREVAVAVAKAVASEAVQSGVSTKKDSANVAAWVEAILWTPEYVPIRRRQ